jgi:hypothetical protein
MSDKEKIPQATKLRDLAAQAQLFKTPEGEACATIPTGTYPVKSQAVRDWLLTRYADNNHGSIPNRQALDDALAILGARARLGDEVQELFTRMGWKDDCLYLDLGAVKGRVNEFVKVSPGKWELCDTAPVKFQRPAGFLPLPEPMRDGKLEELREFVHVPDDTDWVLLSSFLLGCFMPQGPYAFLSLRGEKGSGKTVTTTYLRNVVDPNTAVTTGIPEDQQTLRLRARNSWILAFNNVSSLRGSMSDSLCRLSEGAGDSKKMNYADTDEILFKAARPCIFNGIPDFATASDLLDRLVIISLPPIPDDKRQDRAHLNERYEAARPKILGALLDYAATALANRGNVKLDEKPRMADFAVWIVASELWEPKTFLDAYKQNRADAENFVLENSVEGTAVVEFMDYLEKWKNTKEWKGTATELRKAVTDRMPKNTYGEPMLPRNWPSTAKVFADHLRGVAPALRKEAGIDYRPGRRGNDVVIVLTKLATKEEPTPSPTPPQEEPPMDGDDFYGEAEYFGWTAEKIVERWGTVPPEQRREVLNQME